MAQLKGHFGSSEAVPRWYKIHAAYTKNANHHLFHCVYDNIQDRAAYQQCLLPRINTTLLYHIVSYHCDLGVVGRGRGQRVPFIGRPLTVHLP